MKVIKDYSPKTEAGPRRLTVEIMQSDFKYHMAQRITNNLLDQGLISPEEYKKISELNRQKFPPYMPELLE